MMIPLISDEDDTDNVHRKKLKLTKNSDVLDEKKCHKLAKRGIGKTKFRNSKTEKETKRKKTKKCQEKNLQ